MGPGTVRYTYRLRPGAAAERALLEEWGRCRWLWNEAVHQQQTGQEADAVQAQQTAHRRPRGTAVAPGRIAGRSAAGAAHLRRCPGPLAHGQGAPQTRRQAPQGHAPVAGVHHPGLLRPGRLALAKGVTVPVVWSRDLPSEPASVRVYRDSLGHWYASFVVTRQPAPAPAADGAIGVDWGVAATATTTDPAYDLRYGGHRKRCAAELARAQRTMARRRHPRGQAPSSRYRRARRAACSACFATNKQRPGLGERTFRCESCGHTAGRDRNAARVILAMAERGHAGADDVRHPSRLLPVAGGTRSEPEIPRP